MGNWKARGSGRTLATWVTDENTGKRICTMAVGEDDWVIANEIAALPELKDAIKLAIDVLKDVHTTKANKAFYALINATNKAEQTKITGLILS